MIKQLLQATIILPLLLVGTTLYVAAHDGPHVTVQPGDSLSEIADRYDTDVATLRRLNNLSNSDSIREGGLLALPDPTLSINSTEGRAESVSEATTLRASGELYVVQTGDTLSEIAQRNGMNLALLVEMNQISPAQRLYAGQELRLASGVNGEIAERPAFHTVQPGEHLGTIAVQYGLSAADLARVNQLADPSLITPGQRLTIGDADPQSAPAFDVAEVADAQKPASAAPLSNAEKWIEVDLSEQLAIAYEGETPVKRFVVSSGLPGTPTVTGEFRIWAKTSIQDMYGGNRAAGNYYYLEDVQWVQYFYKDYAFHGAYWHNNFGQPMSRGCINMRNEDAKWLFEWASPQNIHSGWFFSDAANPGTRVVVHE